MENANFREFCDHKDSLNESIDKNPFDAKQSCDVTNSDDNDSVNNDNQIDMKFRKSSKCKIEEQKTEDIFIKKGDGRITGNEASSSGAVGLGVYFTYIKFTGMFTSIILSILYSLVIFTRMTADFWAGKWMEDSYALPIPTISYPIIYILIILALGVFLFLRSLIFGIAVSNATFNISKDLVHNILRRPISFFDTTPSGVILNRCIKDVGELDYVIPKSLLSFLEYLFIYIASFLLLAVVAPYFLIIIALILIVNICNSRGYVSKSIDIKRLTKLATSPVISKINEIVSGAATIRAYKKENFILQKFVKMNNLLTCT